MSWIRPFAQLCASQIDVVFVYIKEAHACDEWKLGTRVEIPQHKTLQERICAAKLLQERLHLPQEIRTFCDGMENRLKEQYSCWPMRCLLIQNEVALVANEPIDALYPTKDLFAYLLDHSKELSISDSANEWIQQEMDKQQQ